MKISQACAIQFAYFYSFSRDFIHSHKSIIFNPNFMSWACIGHQKQWYPAIPPIFISIPQVQKIFGKKDPIKQFWISCLHSNASIAWFD